MNFSIILQKHYECKLEKSHFDNKNKEKKVRKDTDYKAASSAQPFMNTPFL